MHTIKIVVLFVSFMLVAPFHATAGDFDGSKPLIGAVLELYTCQANDKCETVTVEEINFTQFLMIDFKKAEISGTRADGEKLVTPIKNRTAQDGMLMLQGVENGRGWTLSITEATGKMVLTVSGDEVGFVAFGACIPR